MFLVHSVDKPYFGDIEEVASQLDCLREQQALLRHGAWISVKLLHEEAISPENYALLGRWLRTSWDRTACCYFIPNPAG